MKGLKFRTLGVWADVMRTFGADPVATPTADVATALERRVIDAAKMAGPADNLQMGLNRIAPYIIVPGAHLPGGYFTAFMKKGTLGPDPGRPAGEAADCREAHQFRQLS